MRWLFDTNVVASALLWEGTARLLLQAARDKRITLFTSVPLLAELTDILSRRKFEKKLATSQFSVDQIVERYAALTTLVRPIPTPRIAPDPDDDVVIGTALAAHASMIVTGDKPLLSVITYQDVRIIGVREALESLTQGA